MWSTFFEHTCLQTSGDRSPPPRHVVVTAEESSKKWPKNVVVSAAITITRNYRFSWTTAKVRRRGTDPALALLMDNSTWVRRRKWHVVGGSAAWKRTRGCPRRLDDKVPRGRLTFRAGHRQVIIDGTLRRTTNKISIHTNILYFSEIQQNVIESVHPK